MRVIADTNLLVRLVVDDDAAQQRLCTKMLTQAEAVFVSVHALCEMVWVLRSKYRVSRLDMITAIEHICGIQNVVVDRPAAEAGLAAMRAGTDFADGVIAHQGRMAGGDTFVSFDRDAAKRLAGLGIRTKRLQ
jgi:predicted nucleic-acid-binding protein